MIRGSDYKIELIKDENGYLAYINELDCWGDGDSPEEAFADVVQVANDIIDIALEEGLSIPKPRNTIVEKDKCSGNLSLRLPKYLHAEVIKRADKEGCSINQLINSFVSMGIGMKYGQERLTINLECKVEKNQEEIVRKSNENGEWVNSLVKGINRNYLIKELN